MLAAERHERIMSALRAEGAVKVVDLADSLDVSEMTIRRDLDVLDEREVLRKVHGGAIARDNRGVEPPSTAKAARQHAEKVAIGRAALGAVEDGMTIAVSAGTTTLELAKLLRGRSSITVVTNSIPIFQELTGHPSEPDPIVYLTGGSRTPSDALVGPVANAALDSFRVDAVFLGVHGFDVESGLTTPNIAEAETNRRLIATGRRLFVLADNTKYREVGTNVFGRMSDVHTLVVDDGLASADRRALAKHVDTIVVAETENA
ncbi:DeoR/GlpR transcriptional regulator [Rhodococcus sp. BP-252]|uniref:DeoR/GlpR family DNA-binding transcription regulator n=1 Tax=unclassified Rhodococcus (in: high G+C Gram-positive bacteria) TaxID=192944 RepID=UPI001C9B98A7|nr:MULTISPECIES: DeoR/GlpR family DNA-binding transcription regulator [unclassified Rhodococcus (in: high G+C Gram-positive bacteria)]MBY6414341.1 DeoR/GlpR transcriptional regulator [Rhodococcus sp. BP-320]MBY6419111.1 DeoR/GlpR transcriptional regulator [Rhodococcus sp. BP-321]MBY6423798.1 DeoR/GlpR transcriptional regulator [Rhodococcus sp. BP-324]MBY6429182.1 DeoR/GlpR transcriptional regulator [Rhodococcus sp. BP-323]MBY6434151.1 DeoR/GlpR transcriptional regulator [Rhodococcus sp. BP-322